MYSAGWYFFFKQKTAYEIPKRDWSSDVCSSDLVAIRGMKREIDRSIEAKGGEELNVKLGRGGIREIEFLVQALQLLYGGDDPWLRERHSLKAIFRLTERGYLVPELGRTLSHAYVHLRTVE